MYKIQKVPFLLSFAPTLISAFVARCYVIVTCIHCGRCYRVQKNKNKINTLIPRASVQLFFETSGFSTIFFFQLFFLRGTYNNKGYKIIRWQSFSAV